MSVNFSGRRSPDAAWRTSSFCAGGECAEVSKQGELIVLRNSTAPGAEVRYTTQEWLALVQGLRAGEFDDLA